ncbi:hypothetical protein LAD12857_44720 [Lacrimispora amygdalina]|uniref:Uncharacterized protein n=1 Tax=Lacrimispora amygdalina TaxID=253257 RepID=A0ABQ5MCK3_9FIRM
MKYIFGINITDDKNNTRLDGEIFISNSSVPVLGEAFEKCDSLYKNYLKQTSLPFWLRVIKLLSFLTTLLMLECLFLDSSDGSLKKKYADAPELFFISAIFFTVWLILFLVEKSRKSQYSDKYDYDRNYVQNIQNYAKELLHIPEDAEIMEVILIYYKNKKRKGIDVSDFHYIKNSNVYVNVKDAVLHMADLGNEWSIPLASITGITKINKLIFVPEWLKEIPYNKGIYKKYKIRKNGMGLLFFKPYYALCITWQDENYELFIPPYELDKLSTLIGVTYDGNDSNR